MWGALSEINILFDMQIINLTLSPANKLSSAKFLVCINFQCVSMWLKVGENVARVSNRLDPGETPSDWASHLDPSCLHLEL